MEVVEYQYICQAKLLIYVVIGTTVYKFSQ